MHSIARILPVLLLASSAALASPIVARDTAVGCTIDDVKYSDADIMRMQNAGRSSYPPAKAQNDAEAAAFETAMRDCNSNRQDMPAAQFNAIPDNANANPPIAMNGKIPQGQRQSGAPKVGADESEGQQGTIKDENASARFTPSGEHTSSDLTMGELPSNFGEPSSQRASTPVSSTPHDSAKVTESNPNGMPESANANANAKSTGANPSMSTESDPEGMESAGANADTLPSTPENGKKTQVGESESAPQGMPAKENENAKVTPADQHQGSNENAKVHESGAPKVNGSTERQGASPKENAQVDTTGHRQTSPNANVKADESGAPGTPKVNSVIGMLEKGAGQTCTCA